MTLVSEPPSPLSLVPFSSREDEQCPWYVLRVETGRELVINEHLSWRNIAAFVPTYTFVRRLEKRKPETLTRALFPSYVFASFPSSERNLAVQSPGVIGLLEFGGRPCIVEDEQIAQLKVASDYHGVEPWQYLKDGARVRIVDGPLVGLTGRLVKRRTEWRFVISIDLLHRSISVVVDGWTVVAV